MRVIRALTLILCCLGGSASAQTIVFHVASDVGNTFINMVAEGGPEPVLNADEMQFVRPKVRMLFHAEVGNTYERAADIRKASKPLLLQAANTSGLIRSFISAGLIYGTEFDWHFYPGTAPDPAVRLPLVAEFYGDDGSQTYSLRLARMYCYTENQFVARRAVIYPPGVDRFLVWNDSTVASGATGTLALLGEDNLVHGLARSAFKVEAYGAGNTFVDGAIYVMSAFVGGGAEADPLQQVSGISIPTVSLLASTLRAQAQACGGCYFSGDALITDAFHPAEGLVFAEGNVYLSASNMQGNYTLVSATGDITISGNWNELAGSSSLGHVFAVSFGGDIKVSGDRNRLIGEELAPLGMVRVSGSQNLVHGLILGGSVLVTGSGNILTEGTHPHAPVPIY